MLQNQIEERLRQYQDPYLEKDLLSAKAVKRIAIEGDDVRLDLVLGYPCEQIKQVLISSLTEWLAPLLLKHRLQINLTFQVDAHVGHQGIQGLSQVKNIIAVASGKGGVGKSTVAINLALALAQEGAQVGILDADIYGPSQPTMLGTIDQKPVLEEGALLPIIQYGIQSMSIGYLIDQEAPMVWRGPMIGKAMQQLLHDTRWQGLDYLIVDLPPGTGDIQLTLCQKIPVSGALIVTTPQDLALLDVKRACEMFKKLNVPILGSVENMSVYHCSHCGQAEKIFGEGGGKKLAEQYGHALVGSIPLDIRIREMTDQGYPPVLQDPKSHYAQAFYEMARKVAAILSLRTKDYSAKFPKVIVK